MADREDVANGSSRPGVASPARDFAIADDLAPPEITDDEPHDIGKRHLLRHGFESG
jgi:hypothetical protein